MDEQGECRKSDRPEALDRYARAAGERARGLSYGAELQADQLVVLGAQGQVVWQQRLGDRSGLVELDLKGWSNGLYLATLFREGILVGETKFTITGAR